VTLTSRRETAAGSPGAASGRRDAGGVSEVVPSGVVMSIVISGLAMA
jgi:hypothetical protein